jgi:hypothetical protein
MVYSDTKENNVHTTKETSKMQKMAQNYQQQQQQQKIKMSVSTETSDFHHM